MVFVIIFAVTDRRKLVSLFCTLLLRLKVSSRSPAYQCCRRSCR